MNERPPYEGWLLGLPLERGLNPSLAINAARRKLARFKF
jgi:hypothetical protein